jgi:Tfp pilus assembly protein PilF
MKPDETIDYGVMVFRGRFDMRQAAVEARVENASRVLRKDPAAALQLAQEGVAIDPALPTAHLILGDALASMGRKDEARKAWETALALTRQLDTGAQAEFVPRLETRLKK